MGKLGRPPKPPLTVLQILSWADAHYRQSGQWPKVLSGPVPAAPGETWRGVDWALRQGRRGLPGGDSLPQLLRRERGVPERRGHPTDPEQRRAALRLRTQGLLHREIAAQLGVSRQAVQQLLKTAAGGDWTDGRRKRG